LLARFALVSPASRLSQPSASRLSHFGQITFVTKNPGILGPAGFMIPKTFFLAKIIHRIGVQNLRDKKCLHENYARKLDDLHIMDYGRSGTATPLPEMPQMFRGRRPSTSA
jgi:hypothetical protein